MARFKIPPSRARGQVSSRKPPFRAGLAVLLPGLSLGLKKCSKDQSKSQIRQTPHAVGKNKLCLHCSSARWALSAFPKAAAQGPPSSWNRGGRHAPCPDHSNLPRGPPGPYHLAGPSLRLGTPKPPAPVPSPSWNIPEAWPLFPLSLDCRPPFQIHVKSITFLACAHPDTHHSSPPFPGLGKPSFLSIKSV